MYCFNISMVCQFLRLPLVFERSNFGFRVVLKSPPLVIFVVSFNNSNKLWKKEGSSLLGPYMLTMVNLQLYVVALIMTYCLSVSVVIECWWNVNLLCTKIETPHCLLLYVTENIWLYWSNLMYCSSDFDRCVSCNKQISAFNLRRWERIHPFANGHSAFSTETWFLWAQGGWSSVSIITSHSLVKQCLYDWFCLLTTVRETRYMRMRIPYMALGPGQLTVPGGAMVFLFGEEDRDGMATVIFDGQVRRERSWIYNEPKMQCWCYRLTFKCCVGVCLQAEIQVILPAPHCYQIGYWPN